MASDEGSSVELYIYDLSLGIASLLSPAILGEQIEGIWHTSVVVYGHEYFFGSDGINSCAPGSTALGAPGRVEQLGSTFVPFPVFLDYVQGLAAARFAGAAYNLLEHNCNNFSDELAQFLCGARVPKHILELPARLTPALGGALQAALGSLAPPSATPVYTGGVRHSRRDSPDYLTLNHQVEQARAAGAELHASRSSLADKLARRQRRKDKKRNKHRQHTDMAEAVEQEAGAAAALASPGPSGPSAPSGPSGSSGSSRSTDFEERRREEELRREKDPPHIFSDIDGAAELERLSAALGGSGEGGASLDELALYLVKGEGSWALGDDFLGWAGALLAGPAPPQHKTALLRCLAAAALRDDVSLLLHQDRRDHALVNYASDIDRHSLPEQQALALLWCNLFSSVSASEWLLYISEWETERGPLSNIRVTTKVAVHSVLSEDEELRDIGSALMHNIAIKEVKTVVFDDVCVELAMALLQFVGGGAAAAREEHLYRAVRALARLAGHSPDVPQLLHMLAVRPDTYRGASPRVDEQIDLIMTKVK